MNTEVLKSKKILVKWTSYQELTIEDYQVFEESLNCSVGLNYTPIEVSTQVMFGLNYRYKCVASIPSTKNLWEVIIEIFQPLEGKPYITGIDRL